MTIIETLQRIAARSSQLFWWYLSLLVVAETVTSLVSLQLGLILHIALLFVLTIHAAVGTLPSERALALGLTLLPLIRLLSLSLPLSRLPPLLWYPIVSIPLLGAALILIRQLRLSRQALGLQPDDLRVQVMLMGMGLGLGAIEYAILRPAPLVDNLSWNSIALPILILILFTGFAEELIFRGLLQALALQVLGRWALLHVSLLFAALHIGHLSVPDVALVFGVGLLFAYVVRWSGSILGVSLAHGLTNVMLFLFMPHLAQRPPDAVVEAARWAVVCGAASAVIGMVMLMRAAGVTLGIHRREAPREPGRLAAGARGPGAEVAGRLASAKAGWREHSLETGPARAQSAKAGGAPLSAQYWMFWIGGLIALVSGIAILGMQNTAIGRGPVSTVAPVPPTATVRPSPTPSPTPIPVPEGMVLVPAGYFLAGSSTGQPNETPEHPVLLDAYYIDQYEVTNAQYQACVTAGACTQANLRNSYRRLNYRDDPAYAHYPVIGVTWDQSAAYCAWAGKRLPTEAEWEYAASGPENFIWPWGNDFDLNLSAASARDTQPVGSYPDGASLFGIYDMAGNVTEWVADVYDPAFYANSRASNPVGVGDGDQRIYRGGAFDRLDESAYTTSRRYIKSRSFKDVAVGFRCAQDAIEVRASQPAGEREALVADFCPIYWTYRLTATCP